MSLFKRKTRATRKAEARAIKAKAKLEARLAAKNEARHIKADHKAQTDALNAQLKAQRSSDKAALKVAETQLKAVREGKLFSPTRIRRMLTVSRLLAPIVVPLVYRAAAIAARGFVDERRADRLGVPLSQIGQFSPGTALHCLRGSAAPSTRCGWLPRRSRRTSRPSSSSPRSPSGSVTCPPLSRPPRTCPRRAAATLTPQLPTSSMASTPT